MGKWIKESLFGPRTPPKPTISLAATKLTSQSGESVTVSFSTKDADSVLVTDGNMTRNLPTSGALTYQFTQTTTLHFQASGKGGITESQITITVKPPAVTPPIVTPPPVVPPPTTPIPDVSLYYNSREPGGDGRDPTCLWADDLSRGWWYRKNADQSNQGQTEAGHAGSIYAPIVNNGVVPCTFGGGSVVASHQRMSGSGGGGMMAEHELSRMVDDLYVRIYYYFSPDYRFGAEKVLSYNQRNGGGIKYGNLHINVGTGAAQSTGQFQWQPAGLDLGNQSIIGCRPDYWYALELHTKMNTPGKRDGILEISADELGQGHGAPHDLGRPLTRRVNRSDWDFNRKSLSDLFGSLWLENWANPGSQGTRYWAYAYAATRPIGFKG